ncbi:MAG: hypothetical protein EA363_10470 [Balneolaceae bacterium]|nr:MAG: hypothetical protein EA363_10470 [Balneolaceae bacterium]
MIRDRFPGFLMPASLLSALALAVLLAASASTLTQTAAAQPSPSDLADRLAQAQQEHIRQIDRLQITNRITAGMFDGQETTSTFVKVERDGRYVLEPVETDDFFDDDEITGFTGEIYIEMIRNAGSIVRETHDGHQVYRVTVDDPEFLAGLEGMDPLDEPMYDDFDDEDDFMADQVPESVTVWVDRSEMLIRAVRFSFGEENVTVNYRFSNYEVHSGLPVPMVTEVHIEGLEQLISEEDLAEAREAMKQMEAQLEQMPEAQREMIRQQIQPQMERLEQMLESGDIGKARVEVVDVVVN